MRGVRLTAPGSPLLLIEGPLPFWVVRTLTQLPVHVHHGRQWLFPAAARNLPVARQLWREEVPFDLPAIAALRAAARPQRVRIAPWVCPALRTPAGERRLHLPREGDHPRFR